MEGNGSKSLWLSKRKRSRSVKVSLWQPATGQKRPAVDDKENDATTSTAGEKSDTYKIRKSGGWLNTRKERHTTPADFLLTSTPNVQQSASSEKPRQTRAGNGPVLLPKGDEIFQLGIQRPTKKARYCCADCEKWFSGDCGLYASKEEHLRLIGRHTEPPRAPTPPRMWDISFPDSDED